MKTSKVIILFLSLLIISFLIACNKNSTTPPIDEEPNYPKGKIVVYVTDNDSARTPVPNAEIFINPLS